MRQRVAVVALVAACIAIGFNIFAPNGKNNPDQKDGSGYSVSNEKTSISSKEEKVPDAEQKTVRNNIMNIKINGIDYVVGESVTGDYMDNGWTFSEGTESMYSILENKNNEILYVILDENFEKDLKDRRVIKIVSDADADKMCRDVVTAGGITFGSTKSSIEEVYGSSGAEMYFEDIGMDVIPYYNETGGSIAFNLYGDRGVQYIAVESENTESRW